MRDVICRLVELGPIPDEDADAEQIRRHESLLGEAYNELRPVTDDEARALIGLFGPDECFGLAWTILHLVESAPGWPLWDVLGELEKPWVARLRERATRAGFNPPN
jgi:hypothetical protein